MSIWVWSSMGQGMGEIGTGGARSGYVPRPYAVPSRLMRFPSAAALLAALCAVLLTGCGSDADVPDAFVDAGPEQLADLAVTVTRPDDLAGVDSLFSRAAFLSDGRGTVFYDELVRDQTDAAMGLVSGGYRVLDGWQWEFPLDTLQVRLSGRDRSAGIARPDFAVRTYAERDTSGFFGQLINRVSGRPLKRLTERITLVDTMGVVLVHVPDSIGVVDFLPIVSDAAADEYEVRQIGSDAIAMARRNYLIAEGARPVWLAVRTSSGEALPDTDDEVLPARARERGYSYGRLRLQTPATVALATANADTVAVARAAMALRNAEQLLERRQERMVNLLDETYVRTEDERFDRALAWARLSLDALVTGDSARTWIAPGIAGAVATEGHAQVRALGALIASGQWDQALGVLTTITRAQRFDDRTDIFGRAPSSYSVTGEPLFETADATPLFVGAWGDYVRATGETRLVLPSGLNLWRNTVFAGRGLYENRPLRGRQVGPEGFLRTGATDTWMQAESGGSAVIGRDGYPVEAQGALAEYLRTMTDFAQVMGVANSGGRWYADTLRALQRDFPSRYVARDTLLADRLMRDGRPDATPRPSGLYALASLDLDPRVERAAARRIAQEIVYPYGVGTLPQSDSTFRPYLNEPNLYDPETALFTGTVWTALTGPLVQTLAETGGTAPAYQLTETLTGLLLDRGVVGAIAENLDAHPREIDGALADPALGGAPVQPWTLAAYVENAFADYLGLDYRAANEVALTPRLPEAWGETAARFRVGRTGFVNATLAQGGGELVVRLEPDGQLPENAQVRVRAFGQEALVPLTEQQGDSLTVSLDARTVEISADRITIDGEAARPAGQYTALPASYWDGFAFAEPEIPEEYAILRAVEEQRELTDDQITRVNPVALPILSQTDPQTDDWGPNSLYTYPNNVPTGDLDVGFFEIGEDDSTYTFRIELANAEVPEGRDGPPVIIAIALDVAEGGRTRIERGANYDFTPSNGFEYLIWIGDGLLVENKRGQEIGRLANVGSIVDAENAVISFSLPKFVIEDIPRGSRATLVTGALRPGGFVGEFAYVDYEAGDDVGGGRRADNEPNVYDVVEAVVVR
jgi:hypothetical protein